MQIKSLIYVRFAQAVIVLGLIFFLPAGGFDYGEAWIYCGVILIPMFFSALYFLKNDPKLLERRMKMKEKQTAQKWYVLFSSIIFLIAFLIPGFDHRYGWSDVPFWLVIISNIMILLGYLIFTAVMKENSYASRVIEVEKGQKVISTGPYGVVRHPMYSAAIIMFMFTPTALGSWWALLPMILVPPFIIFRLINEEKLLHHNLPGYTAYTRKVTKRLIPWIW